jgi:hypothetical protein
MKDTVHAAVHRSVHLFGEGKSYGALRLRFTRPLILDTDKTPEWAGATPLFATCSWRKNRGGRSSPTNGAGINVKRVMPSCATRIRTERVKRVKNYLLQLRLQRFLDLTVNAGLKDLGT